MCLDSLDRDEELLGDLLVLVAASDQPHHLTLSRAEPVELLVDLGDLTGSGTKGVQDEAREPRREDRVTSATRRTASASSAPEMLFVT